MTNKFSLSTFSEEHGFDEEESMTLLMNLEDESIMNDIANGDYSSFDVDDRYQFNDSYEDMMEDMGL